MRSSLVSLVLVILRRTKTKQNSTLATLLTLITLTMSNLSSALLALRLMLILKNLSSTALSFLRWSHSSPKSVLVTLLSLTPTLTLKNLILAQELKRNHIANLLPPAVPTSLTSSSDEPTRDRATWGERSPWRVRQHHPWYNKPPGCSLSRNSGYSLTDSAAEKENLLPSWHAGVWRKTVNARAQTYDHVMVCPIWKPPCSLANVDNTILHNSLNGH